MIFVGTNNRYSFKKVQLLFHAKQNQKMTPIPHNGIPKASKISNRFPIIESQ